MPLITEHLQSQFVEQQIGLLQLLAMRVFMDTKLHGEDQALIKTNIGYLRN